MSPSPSPEPRPRQAEQDYHRLYFSESFTAVRVGQEISTAGIIHCFYALQVQGSDATPTSFTVTLQGSLDGVNWTTLLTHSTAAGGVGFAADAIPRPARWLRLNCSALTLGPAASIIAHAVAKPTA